MAIPSQTIIDQFAALTLTAKIACVLNALLADNFAGTAYYNNGILFSHGDLNVGVTAVGASDSDTKLTFTVQNWSVAKNATDWTNVKNACSSFRSISSTTGGGSSWTTATVTINLNLSPPLLGLFGIEISQGAKTYKNAINLLQQFTDPVYINEHVAFCSVFGTNIIASI